MGKRCSANERPNRRKHRPRKLKTNYVAARAGYSNKFDRSDKVCRKLQHVVDKLGHLRKLIEKIEVLINDVIELITRNQLILATSDRVVGERKTQSAAVA